MSLQEQLNRKKESLQKVQPILHKVEAKPNELALQDYIHKVREADIESWYEYVKSDTYQTAFLSLSIEEGESFVTLYNIHKRNENREYPSQGICLHFKDLLSHIPNHLSKFFLILNED